MNTYSLSTQLIDLYEIGMEQGVCAGRGDTRSGQLVPSFPPAFASVPTDPGPCAHAPHSSLV